MARRWPEAQFRKRDSPRVMRTTGCNPTANTMRSAAFAAALKMHDPCSPERRQHSRGDYS